MFALPASGYDGPFRSPEAQQWHRDRADESGELPELHERGRITDGHLDELFGRMTTRLEEVRECCVWLLTDDMKKVDHRENYHNSRKCFSWTVTFTYYP